MRRARQAFAAQHARDLGHARLAVHRAARCDSVCCPRSALETTKWWSAQAATCARCVTASTWRVRPSCFISRPTVSATVPPMPASISSKISVGTRCPAVRAGPWSRRWPARGATARRPRPPWPAAAACCRRGRRRGTPPPPGPSDCGSSLLQQRHLEAAAGHAQLLHGLRDRGASAGAALRRSRETRSASCRQACSAGAGGAAPARPGRPRRRALVSSACQPRQQRRQLGRAAAVAARQRHPRATGARRARPGGRGRARCGRR